MLQPTNSSPHRERPICLSLSLSTEMQQVLFCSSPPAIPLHLSCCLHAHPHCHHHHSHHHHRPSTRAVPRLPLFASSRDCWAVRARLESSASPWRGQHKGGHGKPREHEQERARRSQCPFDSFSRSMAPEVRMIFHHIANCPNLRDLVQNQRSERRSERRWQQPNAAAAAAVAATAWSHGGVSWRGFCCYFSRKETLCLCPCG